MGCVLTLLQEGREDVPAGGLEGHWRVRVLVWQEFMDSLVHEHHEGSHAKHDCKEASINFRLHWVQIGQNFSLGVLREGHKKFSTENNISVWNIFTELYSEHFKFKVAIPKYVYHIYVNYFHNIL